jgi:hypothetical protein
MVMFARVLFLLLYCILCLYQRIMWVYFVQSQEYFQFSDSAIALADTEDNLKMILHSVISMTTNAYFGRKTKSSMMT